MTELGTDLIGAGAGFPTPSLLPILLSVAAMGLYVWLREPAENDDDDSSPGGGLMQPVA